MSYHSRERFVCWWKESSARVMDSRLACFQQALGNDMGNVILRPAAKGSHLLLLPSAGGQRRTAHQAGGGIKRPRIFRFAKYPGILNQFVVRGFYFSINIPIKQKSRKPLCGYPGSISSYNSCNSVKYFSASSAALQPSPADVTAWR